MSKETFHFFFVCSLTANSCNKALPEPQQLMISAACVCVCFAQQSGHRPVLSLLNRNQRRDPLLDKRNLLHRGAHVKEALECSFAQIFFINVFILQVQVIMADIFDSILLCRRSMATWRLLCLWCQTFLVAFCVCLFQVYTVCRWFEQNWLCTYMWS